MGVVYKARQLKANREVALKMIRAVEHASMQERIRFQIEAEAVARLQHPNIVQLYEVGEIQGQPFFSLEFCSGGALDKHLKTWRPTPNEAAELVETLARAMDYAHLRGVVHRDLKPANVLLTFGRQSPANVTATLTGLSCLKDATPKITDFGLAKRTDNAAGDVSQSGAIMGTPAYMAPEQAEGKVRDTGPSADVYALGALLYECLTQRPPFVGATTMDTLRQVLNDEPVPPSRLVPQIPSDLETICLKCLRKEPEQRYWDAEALADDLRRYLDGKPLQARPVGRTERFVKWVRRRPAVASLLSALVVLVVLIGFLFVVDYGRRASEQQRARAEDSTREADTQRSKAERLAEDFRVQKETAENLHKEAEILRGRAETARQEAETARKTAETAEKRTNRTRSLLAQLLDGIMQPGKSGRAGIGAAVVYERSRLSTVAVFSADEKSAVTGAGFLIDKNRKLVVTPDFVVGRETVTVFVFFAVWDDGGKLINDSKYYYRDA